MYRLLHVAPEDGRDRDGEKKKPKYFLHNFGKRNTTNYDRLWLFCFELLLDSPTI